MKLILTISFTAFVSAFSFGQKFSVSIKGFQTYLPDSTNLFQKYQYPEVSLDRTRLPDSVYVNQLIRSIAQTDIFITSKGGFGVSGNLEFNLSTNWAFEAGLGIDFFKFNIKRDVYETEYFVLSEEIVPPPPLTIEPPCDRFLSDGQQVVDGDDFSTVRLHVPIKLFYSIWDGEIRFFAGGFFSQTLNAQKRSSNLTLKRKTIEEETVCIFTHNLIEENPIEDLRQMNFGALAGLEYTLFKKLALNISLERSNTFFFADNPLEPSLKDEYPQSVFYTFNFGAKYFIN